MPIAATDIKYYLSGGGANADPNASLGGARSTTQMSATPAGAQFDDKSSTEAAAGRTEYRCFYVRNEHPTLTLIAPKLFIKTQTSSGDTSLEVGLGTSAANGTEQTIVDETTAPAGVTFGAASTRATGYTLPDLPPNTHKAVWVKHITNAGAASATDAWAWRVEGDSNP